MSERDGGKAVVEAIEAQGIEVVFGNPGVHVLSIYDALHDNRRIRHINVKHEGTASFMAEAYGRLTGEPGVCILTAGPGATNSVTGVAQAFASSSPMVHISGTVSGRMTGEGTHSLYDPRALSKILQPVTKGSFYVEETKDIPRVLAEAFTLAVSGRPGPVHVEIPIQVLQSKDNIPPYTRVTPVREKVGRTVIEEVARLLREAARPVIYAGRDVLRCRAWEELKGLVEGTGIPLVEATRTKGLLPHDHPLYAGFKVGWMSHTAADALMNEADLVLSLGVSLGSGYTNFLKKSGARLVHIELQDNPAAKEFDPAVSVAGDIRDFLARLASECAPLSGKWDGGLVKRLAALKEEYDQQLKDSYHPDARPIHPGYIMEVLRECTERDAIVTRDAGTNNLVGRMHFPTYTPNSFLGPDWFAGMGCSLPYAMTAKLLHPDRQVVATVGDGGFLMSYSDFPTAVECGINIVVLVENNSSLGAVYMMQAARYDRRFYSVDLPSLNFASYAEWCGGVGYRVEDPKELGNAIRSALNCGAPAIVDVITEKEVQLPFWSKLD